MLESLNMISFPSTLNLRTHQLQDWIQNFHSTTFKWLSKPLYFHGHGHGFWSVCTNNACTYCIERFSKFIVESTSCFLGKSISLWDKPKRDSRRPSNIIHFTCHVGAMSSWIIWANLCGLSTCCVKWAWTMMWKRVHWLSVGPLAFLFELLKVE